MVWVRVMLNYLGLSSNSSEALSSLNIIKYTLLTNGHHFAYDIFKFICVYEIIYKLQILYKCIELTVFSTPNPVSQFVFILRVSITLIFKREHVGLNPTVIQVEFRLHGLDVATSTDYRTIGCLNRTSSIND